MRSALDENVLITGASGFIGSALVGRLLKDHVPVVATSRGRTQILSRELGTPVSSLDMMEELPAFDGIQTIVHCATPNDIVSRGVDGGLPLAVSGTRALLENAIRHGVKRFVYLSTLQVYGTELSGVVDEDTPVKCESIYGLNHFLGEEVCRYYARTSGMDVVVLRPSNVYGVPFTSTVDRWTLVPMCFVREGLETGRITLRSSGRQLRNFVSTQEVAELIAELLRDFPNGFSVVNAASNWNSSIAEIAGMVEDVWRRKKKHPLDVSILSDHPHRGNDFTIKSRYDRFRPSPEDSRRRMNDVITNLLQIKLH